jgi:tetratricopeptide (TPR) repeat protein
MPLRRIGATEAFATLKDNRDCRWPRRDDPDNRFAHYANPSFTPRFLLEPGQRIFTIGSCFAREVERALAKRGFDVPTLGYQVEKREWGGDSNAILNNYVPQAIAPQIRWAFSIDRFDLDAHGLQMAPGKYIDLFLPTEIRPGTREFVEKRREIVSRIYCTLESSNVVILTLGLVEAWFDRRSGHYINRTPPKSADPERFELHVLDYNEVTSALEDLVSLLAQVCPQGHRIIVTVSPVPLTATFTRADVAVANSYSKSVLRTAVEPLVARHDHVEYFPSYESVLLTERSLAFGDDQIHVSSAMVKFNVDRMVDRYVRSDKNETVDEVIAQSRADSQRGLFRNGLQRLQDAWNAHPDDPKLAVALARALIAGRNGKTGETVLLAHLEKHDNLAARGLLARYYNDIGQHEAAALQTELASQHAGMRLQIGLERATAYYHLGRFQEGLAVLDGLRSVNEARPKVVYWKARLCEKLGRLEEAEAHYRRANTLVEDVQFKASYAEFLAEQDRWPDVIELVDEILLMSPSNLTGLRLRTELRRRGLQVGRPSTLVGRVYSALHSSYARVAHSLGKNAAAAQAARRPFEED